MVQGVVGTELARRRQFSSCDFCRKSRIACDASRIQERQQISSDSSDAGSSQPQVQCTNCLRRAVSCTYEWIRNRENIATANKAYKPRTRRQSRRSALNRFRTTAAVIANSPEHSQSAQNFESTSTVSAEDNVHTQLTLNSNLSRRAEAVKLHNQLWTVFTEIFEPVLSLWTGPDCSPYVVPTHMSGLTVLQLVVSLDWVNCSCGPKSGQSSNDIPASRKCSRCDRAVQLALISSVHAFSLRWLPLLTGKAIDNEQLMSLGDRLWQNARTRVMSVFDKLSYQTVLALYLFGLTPVYEGAFADAENAHTAGETSVDMALRQIHRLRVKRQDPKFSGAGLSLWAGGSDKDDTANPTIVNNDFIHAENMMYWAGVVFDTSSSMTRGCPSILCSGVFGFEEEPVFRLMKARVQLFHESTETWRQNGFLPTSHNTLYIVHRASTWKGYMWKIIGALREAINNGYEECFSTKLKTLIGDAIERFDRTFKPLLATCEKHILFLSKEARLCYYLLQLHYYMGLVLLCNLTSSIEREDMVPHFETVRRESVHAIFTTISFGLSCQVAFNNSEAQHGKKLSSLISLDPYPHHILASLQLAADVLLGYLKRDEIAHDAFENSRRIVFDTLDELPQCLRSVQRVKTLLYHKLAENFHQTDNGSGVMGNSFADLSRFPREHQHQPLVRNEHNVGDRDTTSEEPSSNVVGSTQEASFSALNPSDIDESGLKCLSETLFSGPAIVLSTTTS